MSKKTASFYFDTFIECAEYSCQAADLLCETLKSYQLEKMDNEVQRMHHIEHCGDRAKHELVNTLMKAFITPIERDDILQLSSKIDDVTDAIEDIVIHMNITQVRVVRPEAVQFAVLLAECCRSMKKVLEEFQNFRKSKSISERIIELNHLEEKGDLMYIQTMKDLHIHSKDPLELIVWRELFDCFENACDACEDVGDIVESIIIGNT